MISLLFIFYKMNDNNCWSLEEYSKEWFYNKLCSTMAFKKQSLSLFNIELKDGVIENTEINQENKEALFASITNITNAIEDEYNEELKKIEKEWTKHYQKEDINQTFHDFYSIFLTTNIY